MATIPDSVKAQLDADWTGAGGAEPAYYVEEDFRTNPPLGEDAVWIMSSTLDTDSETINDKFATEKHVLEMVVNTLTSEDRLKELGDEVVRILNATAITDITYQRLKRRKITSGVEKGVFNYQEVITYDLQQQMKDSAASFGPGSATAVGTQWTLPVFDTTTSIGDSMITQDAGGTEATVGGNLTTTGDIRVNGGDLRASDNSSGIVLGTTKTYIVKEAQFNADNLLDSGGNTQIAFTAGSKCTLAYDIQLNSDDILDSSAATVISFDGAGAIDLLELGVSVTECLDEDNMASDSATKICTQQSIKKYVDDNILGGGMADLVDDITPQLGGDLDLNGKNIDFPTTANISDVKDEDNMASDSATMLATQQSIKAYVDTQVATQIANVVEDATPQLGGDLDLNGNSIDFPTTANISDVKDEDNMASDSATMLATQQSIKKYVDDNAGAGTPHYREMIENPCWGSDFASTSAAAMGPFYGYAIGGGSFTSPVAGDITSVNFGTCRIRCGTSANSGYRISTTANAGFEGTGAGWGFDAILSVNRTTDTIGYIGYHDSISATNPNDGIYIDMRGTTLSGYASGGGSDTQTGTSYTFTVDTWYHVRGVVDAAGTTANFYVYNMAGAELWTDDVTGADLPTAAQMHGPMFTYLHTASGTAYDICHIDLFTFWCNQNIARGYTS